ncbi:MULTISPECIES: hypothetical protein [Salinibaculum]|uniref:hypothetical protein n=1 Tax=Salinibaculum TaxID=2732368 RepID=UPI0030CA9F99
MDGSYVEDALTDAQQAFEREPAHKESGLDVDDDALLQLRKACRLLDAARFLRTQNGYYTVVIETSFIAIERSIHFYLLHATGMDSTEFVSHTDVYQRGAEANLYSRSLGDQLLQLWRENRSKTYYRQAVGGEMQANTMLQLATAIHHYILDLLSVDHECVCNRE